MERAYFWARHLSDGAPAPSATITVKDHGTDTLSTLFSDNGVTPLANPFTGTADGYCAFYAANGRYDATVTPVSPDEDAYTLTDLLLYDPEDA